MPQRRHPEVPHRQASFTLRALNGWRGAAQHYVVVVSEEQLYLASQAAVTLFDDLLGAVFGETLRDHWGDATGPAGDDRALAGQIDHLSKLQ